MYDIAALPDNELAETFQTSARLLHISPTIVEKDFWVTILLDYLFNKCQYKDMFLLKGGTSLSKGHGYTNRFSEDIDLVIKYTYFDSHIEEILSENISNNHRNILCELLNKQVWSFVDYDLYNDIKINFGKLIHRDINLQIDDNDPLTLKFDYPKYCFTPSILNYVKIETGVLSGIEPTEEVDIAPLIYECNPNKYPVETYSTITILAAKRTFWEKINAIHSIAVQPEEKPFGRRLSRHYYDIYKLCETDVKDSAIQDTKLQKETIKMSDAFYHNSWLDVKRMLNKQYKLVPSEERLKKLREDYGMMQSMIYGSAPTFDEIINSIMELEKEINSLA